MRWLRIALAFFLAVGSRIQAQDALRNALSLDPALAQKENALAESPPNQSHLGPVQFTLNPYLTAAYEDNINESEFNPVSDVIVRPGLNVSLFWPATERSELRFSSDLVPMRTSCRWCCRTAGG